MSELLEHPIHCPYCDAPMEVLVEPLDDVQEYIEDCQVCCQPIVFQVEPGADGMPEVSLRREDDTF